MTFRGLYLNQRGSICAARTPMPQRKAEILDLHAEGRTAPEIADLLGVTVNAVHQRCLKYGIRLRSAR